MTEIFIRITAKMTDDESETFKNNVLNLMKAVPKLHSAEMISTNDKADVKIVKLRK